MDRIFKDITMYSAFAIVTIGMKVFVWERLAT